MGDPVRAPARRRMYLPREVTAVLTIGSLGNRCDAALGASDERRTRLFRSGSIIPMKRRELIVGVGAVAILWPCATRAEQTTMPVIGFLSPAHPRILRINYLAFGKASPKWLRRRREPGDRVPLGARRLRAAACSRRRFGRQAGARPRDRRRRTLGFGGKGSNLDHPDRLFHRRSRTGRPCREQKPRGGTSRASMSCRRSWKPSGSACCMIWCRRQRRLDSW